MVVSRRLARAEAVLLGPNCYGGPEFVAELSRRRIIPLPSSGGGVQWIADGRQLAWTTAVEQKKGLRVASVDGGHPKALPIWGTYFEWAPDGKRLLVCRPNGLWTVEPGGGRPRQLVRLKATPFAHWVDTTTIVYSTG